MLLLAVLTVVVTISVSFWMGGVASLFSKPEQVEISGAYASKLEDGGWKITAQVRNTGSIDATLELLLINGKEPSEFGSRAVVVTPSLPLSLRAGSGMEVVEISVKAGTSGFLTGATVNVMFRSSSGRHYPKTVTLL